MLDALLLLLPALLVGALVLAGWLPGEERILRAARRRARRRLPAGNRRISSPRPERRRDPHGRTAWGARSSRGPPLVVA
ncbi:hypothetical protein [Patulibacter defluvii]|uniref:hypothetical protein n=1 Tax=Patulibacter defluvii TaxID=3095358 RepID=UPI002A74E602|nr:hypothetical protein [Patulibacter sp. DM4]